MKPCPILGCPNGVHNGKLLCFAHWRAVPFELQMRVQRTWRNFKQATKPNMQLACLRAYRVARDEAVKAVGPREVA